MNNVLCHYGVLGMRWGRRKAGSRPLVFEKKKYDRQQKHIEEAKRAEEVKKQISSLSDDEIRSRINRINMEQQYMKLINPEPQYNYNGSQNQQKKSSLVRDTIRPAVVEAGKQVIKDFLIKKGNEILKPDTKQDELSDLKIKAQKAVYKKKILEYQQAKKKTKRKTESDD